MSSETQWALPDEWEEIGEEDEPGGARSHLLSRATMGGVNFHVEAFQMAPDPDATGLQDQLQGQDTFEAIHAAIEGDREPWQTVEIEGRDYVVIVSPFCR